MNGRRVLLDENLPTALRLWLPDMEAVSVEYIGWKGVRNGDLVRRAKAERFDVLVTADRELVETPRIWTPLGCVRVTSNDFALLRAAAPALASACRSVLPGQVLVVQV